MMLPNLVSQAYPGSRYQRLLDRLPIMPLIKQKVTYLGHIKRHQTMEKLIGLLEGKMNEIFGEGCQGLCLESGTNIRISADV